MAKEVLKLERWSVVQGEPNPYKPPEQMGPCLKGDLDGHEIVTSPIIKAEGLLITTFSGSLYELGEIEPGYMGFIEDHAIEFDPENPIKALER